MKKVIMGALALSLVMSFSSCDDENKVDPQPEIVDTKIGMYISGVVTENGNPLAGVTVSADGATATTDASGLYMLTVEKAGMSKVTASKDGYISVSGNVTVSEKAVASLNFELFAKNASETLAADSELTLVEARDKVTSMVFPANAVSENTEVSITEYTTHAASDEMGAISVVYCEPSGQKFSLPVRVAVDKRTGSDVQFADMAHYVLNESGNWVVESKDVRIEDGAYVCELTHFSSHAFGPQVAWQAGSSSTEDGASMNIDNLGKVNSTSQEVKVSAKNGWEVDGDVNSTIKAALAGISASDAEALATGVDRMLRNAKGSSPKVNTNEISLGKVEVSGDTKATIQVVNKIVSSTMNVDVLYKGTRVTLSIPVKEYQGADMKVSYEYGTMRPEHSGGDIH